MVKEVSHTHRSPVYAETQKAFNKLGSVSTSTLKITTSSEISDDFQKKLSKSTGQQMNILVFLLLFPGWCLCAFFL